MNKMTLRQVGPKETQLNYPNEERRHDEINSSASYRAYMQASVDYGKLLVTNLIFVNAGALLVFPTLLDKVKTGSLNADTVTGAATMFVCGLFCAMVSGFIAYLNFMWIAHQSSLIANRKSFVAKCDDAMLEFEPNKKILDDIDKGILKFGRWIQRSFYSGVAVGILSFVFFVIGCSVVRSDVLSHHGSLVIDFIKQLNTALRMLSGSS